MKIEHIPFKKTAYVSSLICDYLDETPPLQSFYNRYPNLNNVKTQIEEKTKHISVGARNILVRELKTQYLNCNTSKATKHNIEALKSTNAFTVTTGHQLNLFTGPLYFIYKIGCAIKLCNQLNKVYPNYNFVPVYWMASEDHDYEEINHFNFKGKKVTWNSNQKGAVGDFSTTGLKDVLDKFKIELGLGINAKHLANLFKNTYVNHDNLAEATRYLTNELFAQYGLVIIDGNSKALKQQFVPYVKDELFNKTCFNTVIKTSKRLKQVNAAYKIQVNPREINLFYITKGLRERIVFEDKVFKINNTDKTFTKQQLLEALETYPERFSPNALMRPLYQEVVLPNLCYIGGSGELAYWLQLKDYFNAVEVTFPMLLLRNSILIVKEKQSKKIEKLNLKIDDLFLKQQDLVVKKTKELSKQNINFTAQKTHLQQQFEALYSIAEQTDKSFLGAVAAQEKKQLNGLNNLEKRLLKAEKKQLKQQLDAIKQLQDSLFPNKSLQERNLNFGELYLEFGQHLIEVLIKQLQPLKPAFIVIHRDNNVQQ